MKNEFESTFGSDNDASYDYRFTPFPKALNPGFDLQIALTVSTRYHWKNHRFCPLNILLVWFTTAWTLLQ